MVVTFLENTLNVGISTHALVLHSKFQEEFFETLLGEQQKQVDDFSIRKYEYDLKH